MLKFFTLDKFGYHLVVENVPTRISMSTKIIVSITALLLLVGLVTYAAVEYRRSDDCLSLADDPVRWNHLVSQWEKNNVVMVLRHASKCDIAEPTCINGNEALTSQGRLEAKAIGLGVQSSLSGEYSVVHSYLDRTRDTALLAFGTSTVDDALAKPCKNTFTDYISTLGLGTNHILVTHSSCLDSLKRNDGGRLLGINTSKDPHFGIAAMLERKPDGKTELIGCMWPTSWADIQAVATR